MSDKFVPDSKGKGCEGFVPEENTLYPLCDRPNCVYAKKCNISAHMDEKFC